VDFTLTHAVWPSVEDSNSGAFYEVMETGKTVTAEPCQLVCWGSSSVHHRSDFQFFEAFMCFDQAFKYKKFFKQIRELPMGNKISGLLAHFYMDSIERTLVTNLSVNFYYTYVDDCLLIMRSREEEIMLHSLFNNANHHIKFEIEYLNNEGSLSLLDFTVNVFHPYIKSIKSDIFTSGELAMPSKWKLNIISNEWKRLRSRCTSVEEKKKCHSTFIEKLKNGHQKIPFLELKENSHSFTQKYSTL
jgi:hypothetical protein